VKLVVPAKLRVPVLRKVIALVIVPPEARATLYPTLAVFNVAAVRAPVKVIVPVVLVNVTVEALTVLLKVAPPEFVTVTVSMLVPTAPDTVTVPVVLKVRFEEPEEYPVTDDIDMGVATPVPRVRV
jgi:hypothetical protein